MFLHIFCQLALLLVLDFHDAGAVIVYTIVCECAVSLCHVDDADTVCETADADGRCTLINVGEFLKFHLSEIIESVLDTDITEHLPGDGI